MNFTNIKNKIFEAFETTGFARTAEELQKLSDRQLEDLGISRYLLKKGASGFPWREKEALASIAPGNLSKLETTTVHDVTTDTPKAA